MPKPHLSHSQLSMLRRCGLQYEFRYIEGIKAPPGVAALRGRSVHGVVRKDLTNKMQTGALLERAAVTEGAAATFEAEWDAEAPHLTPEEKLLGARKLKGATKDTVIALAELHHDELAPDITPTHVERAFRLETPGPYDLLGYIDVMDQRADGSWVRDTKTAAKSPSKGNAETSDQLTVYSLAVKVLDGKSPAGLALDHLVATKKPKTVTLTTTRGEADYRRYLDLVARAGDLIQAGKFLPAEEGHWCCSEKWCGYWNQCPHGKRGRTQAQVAAIDV